MQYMANVCFTCSDIKFLLIFCSFSPMMQHWHKDSISRLSCWSSSWTSFACLAMMLRPAPIWSHMVEFCFHHSCNRPEQVNAWKKTKKHVLTHLADSQSDQTASQMGIFMRNIVLFSSTLLQILYNGIFVGDAENLLSFLADQIVMVRQ